MSSIIQHIIGVQVAMAVRADGGAPCLYRLRCFFYVKAKVPTTFEIVPAQNTRFLEQAKLLFHGAKTIAREWNHRRTIHLRRASQE